MITVEHLRKHYGDFVAVDDISFDIKKGEIVGFLGPNGAGKTTTMRVLTGYLEATSGTVVLNNFNVEEDALSVKRSIGYLPENAPLYLEMKVREYLDFIASVHGIPSAKRHSRIVEVTKMTGIDNRLGTEIGHLSKGLRQRVGLSQAMIHDPEILILDEPTSGLDPNQRIEIRNLIKEIGKEKTVILSTHILSEAEATCDRAIIIHEGKIVASGTIAELNKQHGGVQVVKVSVEGPASGFEDLLQKLDGAVRVIRLDSDDSLSSSFDIEFEGEEDPRKRVMKFIGDSSYDLLEMSREESSLEDVFSGLTTQKE
jgi:ABC-2 type transport system ATP-binding protein